MVFKVYLKRYDSASDQWLIAVKVYLLQHPLSSFDLGISFTCSQYYTLKNRKATLKYLLAKIFLNNTII